MNKKRHFLFTLIIVAMCISMLLFAVACKNDDNKPNDEDKQETTNELFANGEFTLSTGDNFPKVPTSWDAAAGSSSAEVGSDASIGGVIDTTEKAFKSNAKTYGKIDNPAAGSDADPYILMLYNKVKTSQKYTSKAVTLDKASYYKLSFKVKTMYEKDETVDSDKQGAFVYLNGDAYAAFRGINTNSEWKEYTIYIETSLLNTSSITLTLSLGDGTNYTKGHVFFDSVVLENLVKDKEDPFTAEKFKNITDAEDDNIAKYSMIAGDSEFEYATGTGSILSPAKYSGLTGTGSDGSAPSSSTYVEKGIYNVNKTKKIYNDGKEFDLNKQADTFGSNILFINNKQATAYGFRSNTPMKFAAKDYYSVSVLVKTVNIANGGATVKLTNGTANDDRSFVIKDINTNNEWEKITFYVQSNETRDNKLYLEMWLGEGGKEDTSTHVKGIAMFDHITIEKITEALYNEQSNNTFTLKSTATTPISLSNTAFKNTTYDETINVNRTVVTQSENEITINNTLPSVYSISNFTKVDDKLVINNPILIHPNNFYLISMMVKTENIEKGKGLNITLVAKAEEGFDYASSVLTQTSLASLNSEDLEDNEFAIADGFTEIRFFIKGGILKDNEVGIQFSLGSGKSTQSSSHVMGKAIIKDLKIETVTSSEYSNASRDAVTATSAFEEKATANGVSNNGSFNLIDAAATKELYKDVKDDADQNLKVFDENGKLVDVLGSPKSWTITNKDAIINPTSANRSLAGVLDLDSPIAKDHFGITDKVAFFAGTPINVEDTTTVLAFDAKNATFGYSSDSISLAANSYSIFTVWAKTVESTMSIELATKSGSGKETSNFYNVTTNGEWKKFTFYVETGLSSVSVKLTLSVGNPIVSSGGTNGKVFFSEAKYDNTLTEDTYKKAVANLNATSKAQSWFVDSFDVASPSSDLSSPTNWNGELIDPEAKSDKEYLVSGVFDKTSGDWKNLDIDPDKQDDVFKAIFPIDENSMIGDSVLAIYNKKPTAYKYSSISSKSLEEKSFYKVSISVLTYGLKAEESATITLKLNNQTYSFGKKLNDNSTEYDKQRKVNTSNYDSEGKETIGSWKEYTFYVNTQENATPTATISVGLGYNAKDNWKSGYVFVDNYSVEEITEEEFITRKEGQEDDSILNDDTLVPTTYRIVLTEEYADAEENKTEPEEEETKAPDKSKDLLWLWISSGIVGAVILIVLIVYLIKKYGKKKNKSFKAKK